MPDLFDQNSEPTTPVEIKVEDFVGEGKRFADVDTLLKSKIESDNYIKTKEKQNDELRDELTSRLNMGELISQLKTVQQTPSTPAEPGEQTIENPENPPAIDPNAILDRVRQEIRAESEAEKKSANVSEVRSTLERKWGSDFATTLREKAAELGISEKHLNGLAEESPKAFFTAVGVESSVPQSPRTPDAGGSVNTTVLQQGDESIKNAAYYAKMKATDPAKYFSKAIQSEMHHSAAELKKQGLSWN